MQAILISDFVSLLLGLVGSGLGLMIFHKMSPRTRHNYWIKITDRLWHGSEGFFEWRKLDTVELLIPRWQAVWLSALRGQQDLLNLNRVQVYNNNRIIFLSLWSICMYISTLMYVWLLEILLKNTICPKVNPLFLSLSTKQNSLKYYFKVEVYAVVSLWC